MTTTTSKISPSDMAQSRLWTADYFSNPNNLPVSFLYSGKRIEGIPESWNPTEQKSRIDANILQTVFAGLDQETGLATKVECLEYRDYPVVEWTAWLANRGDRGTPIVSDFLALDSSFVGKSPMLTHCNGDFYSQDGYTPQELNPE